MREARGGAYLEKLQRVVELAADAVDLDGALLEPRHEGRTRERRCRAQPADMRLAARERERAAALGGAHRAVGRRRGVFLLLALVARLAVAVVVAAVAIIVVTLLFLLLRRRLPFTAAAAAALRVQHPDDDLLQQRRIRGGPRRLGSRREHLEAPRPELRRVAVKEHLERREALEIRHLERELDHTRVAEGHVALRVKRRDAVGRGVGRAAAAAVQRVVRRRLGELQARVEAAGVAAQPPPVAAQLRNGQRRLGVGVPVHTDGRRVVLLLAVVAVAALGRVPLLVRLTTHMRRRAAAAAPPMAPERVAADLGAKCEEELHALGVVGHAPAALVEHPPRRAHLGEIVGDRVARHLLVGPLRLAHGVGRHAVALRPEQRVAPFRATFRRKSCCGDVCRSDRSRQLCSRRGTSSSSAPPPPPPPPPPDVAAAAAAAAAVDGGSFLGGG